MIQRRIRLVFLIVVVILLLLPLLAACNDDGGDDTPKSTSTPKATSTASPPAEDVTFKVGYITDLTGPASTALTALNMSVEDIIDHYNDENLIPGLTIELLTYDGQYDPSRDLPGYEWLMERGADLILTQVPHTIVTLKPQAESDQVLMFAGSAEFSSLQPPGNVFSMGTIPDHEAITLLQWISQYDWDYETKGLPKIGGAGHNDSYTTSFLESMEAYAKIHPDQFEWVGGHLAPIGTFTWGPEVEALKECDYLFAPAMMTTFVKGFSDAGSTAKLIGTDVHLAFLSQIYDAKLWDEIDGMLFIRSLRWWNEEGTLIDFTKQLLNNNHSDKSQEIMHQGTGYLAVHVPYQMLNIIARAAEEAGPQYLDFTALYQAAESHSMVIDDVERFSFDESKRYSMNSYAVYEARGPEEDLFRISDWIPAVLEP